MRATGALEGADVARQPCLPRNRAEAAHTLPQAARAHTVLHAPCPQEMRAFWLPSKTPEARVVLGKPSLEALCPASGKPLRLKDLAPVKFTPVPDGGPTEYMDPVTRDPFTNASRLVVLKPTGGWVGGLVGTLRCWGTCC